MNRRLLGIPAFLTLLAACGGDGPTPPVATPGDLLRTSAEQDSVPAGQTLSRPIEVRVEDMEGAALADVNVRFEVLSGPGSVDPTLVTSAADGTASTVFTAAAAVGVATVRATLPDFSGVDPVDFSVRVLSTAEASLAAVSGEDQAAEPASQLPRPFVVEATSPAGTAVAGVRVEWAVTAGTGATLSAPFGFTDQSGRVQVLLTLGSQGGEYRVRATSPTSVDTVVFAATAAPSSGAVIADSVRPLPLVAGQAASLFGTGFGATAAENEVLVEGAPATITTASAIRIDFTAPALPDRCLPARSVGVRAIVGADQSNGLTVNLEPVVAPRDLALGERIEVVGGEEIRCLQFAAGAGSREYRIAVQSASQSATAITPMRVVLHAGPESGAGPVTTVRLANTSVTGSLGAAWLAALDGMPPAASLAEIRLRSSAREALLARGARPSEGGAAAAGGADGAFFTAAVPPSVGDTIPLALAVNSNLTVSCTDTAAAIRAEVKAVGNHFALLQDIQGANGGLTDADFNELVDEFDQVIFAVDSAYFGAPADIDDNDRVFVLFTPEVNELTPADSDTRIGGFFIPTDLAESGDGGGDGFAEEGNCPTSNEAEILYLLAADTDGDFGQELSRENAKFNARSVSSHEFQHLISAEQRIFVNGGGFGDLEATWLGEGLSHVAEEVAGFRAAGLQERDNLGLQASTVDVDAFNAFHLQNFLRLQTYFENPSGTEALAFQDPGGIASLEMRGFAWIFLRWLGDHKGPDGGFSVLGGSGEAQLFRELADGGPNTLQGVANIERAVNVVTGAPTGWEDMLAEFAIMPAVDDIGLNAQIPESSLLLTWDLRDVFLGLHENSGTAPAFPEEYPLEVASSDFTTGAFEFDVQASTERYFRFGPGAADAFSLEVSNPLGGPVSASALPQVTIVRTQ